MLLYSMDGCPWCEVLKMRLNHSKIEYEEIKDEATILEKGFPTVPRLQVDNNTTLDFEQAIRWVNAYEPAAGAANA